MITLTITGGEFRGRTIHCVANGKTRYTPEKVRLALFSILRSYTEIGIATILDLCAGSGIIGFEALSRGFQFCDSVEVNAKSIATIQENSVLLRVEKQICIHRNNVLFFLKGRKQQWDVVFMDPPFQDEIATKLFTAVSTHSHIVKENGLMIIEYEKPIEALTGFCKVNQYRYGNVFLNLYRRITTS